MGLWVAHVCVRTLRLVATLLRYLSCRGSSTYGMVVRCVTMLQCYITVSYALLVSKQFICGIVNKARACLTTLPASLPSYLTKLTDCGLWLMACLYLNMVGNTCIAMLLFVICYLCLQYCLCLKHRTITTSIAVNTYIVRIYIDSFANGAGK